MEKHLPMIIGMIVAGALIYWTIKVLTGVVVAIAPIFVTGLVFLIAAEIYERNKRK
jgi:hypothetical protein